MCGALFGGDFHLPPCIVPKGALPTSWGVWLCITILILLSSDIIDWRRGYLLLLFGGVVEA